MEHKIEKQVEDHLWEAFRVEYLTLRRKHKIEMQELIDLQEFDRHDLKINHGVEVQRLFRYWLGNG